MIRERPTKRYCCHYHHDRADWALTITAYDWLDAEARCRKLGLTLDGELMGTVSGRLGWLAKLICWFRNRFGL